MQIVGKILSINADYRNYHKSYIMRCNILAAFLYHGAHTYYMYTQLANTQLGQLLHNVCLFCNSASAK